MTSYVTWVVGNPLLSAAIQFAILGTLGEVISFSLKRKRPALPCNQIQLAAKILAWAILGIVIKYGFTGMTGFTRALLEHNLLPSFMVAGVGFGFAVSVMTNFFFGPQMMFFHRLEDNLILWEWNMEGLKKAWWTLIWFWIPAHTITFSLPKEFQIGLAAIWSLALGIILGLAKKQ
ncbi:conserved membrane hypothetical protein [Candidatus Zixiibacteriota bacterium]|nr:conserved membrane hypothetical protein [candidate division Zixibacteria bacterium]